MANGKEGSSSNPRPIEVVPRRGRGRAPQGRVNRPGELIPPSQTPPVMGVPGQSAFTPYARPPQQAMGVPGQSAFSPYGRPAAPLRHGHPGQLIPPSQMPLMMGVSGQSAFTTYQSPSQPLLMGVPGQSTFTHNVRPPQPPSDSNRGPIGFGGAGAQTVPVGGSGSGDVVAPGTLRIGGSPAERKRAPQDVAGDGGGGDQPVNVNENQVRCTVCGRVFRTPKALFGHMRSHPDRGWKGAHPPPAFRAEEEFADLHGEEAAVEGGVQGMEEEVEAEGEYELPDLNKQPPRDSN